MNNLPRQKLKYIIDRYGRSLAEDPKRCEAFLRDFCGQYRKEISVLVNAIKEGIPADLLDFPKSVPSDLLLARMTKKLEDRLAINQEAARWGVESWALALGLISEVNQRVVESSSPPPPVSPQYSQEVVLSSVPPTPSPIKIDVPSPPNSQAPQPLDTAKITVVKKASQKIKTAWIAGCLSGGFSLIIALAYNPAFYIDVILVLGLSFGIHKKSRICAIILLACFIIKLLILLLTQNPYLIIMAGLLNYCFFQGVQGTFTYYKLQGK